MSDEIKKVNVLALAKVAPFVYDNYLTYLELSLALAKKLNELILNVNDMSDIVNSIDTNFTEIYAKIDTLNNNIDQLYKDFDNFEVKVYNIIDRRFQIIYNQILSLMNDYQIIFNSQLQELREDLDQQINDIVLGNITAYDPTTGEYENISTVIMNVYDSLRQNSINVNEFESLDLTALVFDQKEITAYNFDINGKMFLMGS